MIHKLRAALSAAFIERDAEIEALILGLVAQEHVLLVGPPGTGKSALCRALAAGIDGVRYSERLLAPTTPPEAIFGPISLAALRQDRYEHVLAGSIADAELVFLDEFFRGSPAIRDTLLHLLGPERQALIGTQQVRVPLRSAVGAANHWDDAADQAAILDRWLIRRSVSPVSPRGQAALLRAPLTAITPQVTLAEIDALSQRARELPVTEEAYAALLGIVEELRAAGIRPSDRRLRASLRVARAAAAIDGATEVRPIDLEPLTLVLWDDPREQPAKCAEIIVRRVNPAGAQVAQVLREADEIISAACDTPARMAAIRKLDECEQTLRGLGANGRATSAIQYLAGERQRLSAIVLGISPGGAR